MRNKKGFTLTELLGVVVILSILVTIGLTVYGKIKDSTLQKQYENVVTRVAAAGENYAKDLGIVDDLYMTVEELIQKGKVEPDDEDSIFDPRNNESINCYVIHIKFVNGKYETEVDERKKDGDKCNFKYTDGRNAKIICNGADCSNNWYSGNVELKIAYNEEFSLTVSKIIWTNLSGFIEEANEVTTDVESVLETTYTATLETEEGPIVLNQEIKIDREKPTINIEEEKTTKGERDWFREVRLKVNLFDIGSGIDKASYCTTNASVCTPNTEATLKEESFSVDLTAGYNEEKICIKAVDKAGLESEVKCSEVYKIDKKAPTYKVTQSTVWVQSDTLKVDLTDNGSGIIAYAWTTTETQPTNWTTIDITSSTTMEKYLEANGIHYAWFMDAAGNVGHVKIEEKLIDRTVPEVDKKGVKKDTSTEVRSGDWSNKDISITPSVTNPVPSGTTMYYCTSPSNCTPTTTKYTSPVTISSSSKVCFQAISGSGVKSKVNCYDGKIDKTVPTVSASGVNAETGKEVLSGHWTNKDIIITSKIGRVGLSGATIYYCLGEGCTPGTQYKQGITIRSSKTYCFQAVTGAGNSSIKVCYDGKIDKTVPTVSTGAVKAGTSTPVGNGDWSNKDLNVTMAVTNTIPSGTTLYYCSGAGCNPGTKYTGALPLTSSGTYCFKAVSGSGNVSSTVCYNGKIDKGTPSCSVSRTGSGTGGVSVTITCSNTGGSGISNCAGAGATTSTTKGGLKSSQTYTVTNGAGTSSTCSIAVSSSCYQHKICIYKYDPKECTKDCCGVKTYQRCSRCSCEVWNAKVCHGYGEFSDTPTPWSLSPYSSCGAAANHQNSIQNNVEWTCDGPAYTDSNGVPCPAGQSEQHGPCYYKCMCRNRPVTCSQTCRTYSRCNQCPAEEYNTCTNADCCGTTPVSGRDSSCPCEIYTYS